MRIALLILALLSLIQNPACAYIDPGSGGYLMSSIVVAIGGFFAFASAVLIHFFRNTLGGWFRFMWQKHRILLITGSAVAITGIGLLIHSIFYEPRVPPFNPAISGVHRYDPKRSYDGYNLFEGRLIDMNGNIVKKWSSTHLGVLDKNGDYYAQKYFDAPVWGRYTWDDKVVWEKNFPIHHELLLTPYGTIITFTKDVQIYQGRKVEFDVILEFDKDGNQIQRYSTWDHFNEIHQFHRKMQLDLPPNYKQPKENLKKDSPWGGDYDYYHANALSLIPPNSREGVHPAFKPGNWLISFRHGSMLFILDKDTKELRWRAIDSQVPGKIEGPHSPQMLENGDILIFDNGRYRKWSRAVEIDPATLKVVWEYRDNKFYTLTQGFAQKLPNGNVLITETEKGRAFEVTPSKDIVWEYYHPEKQTGADIKDKKTAEKVRKLRKEIYRMNRYPRDFIDGLLQTK